METKRAVAFSELGHNDPYEEEENNERESLAWEGAEILKSLQDPPRIWRTLTGVVALAVIAPDAVIAVVAQTAAKALYHLAEDTQAMIQIRRRQGLVPYAQKTL